MAHMTETERMEYLENLFKYARDQKQLEPRTNVVYNFMRVLWGRGESYDGGECFRYVLPETMEKLVRDISVYAACCVRACPSCIAFETICNGLRNAYYDGQACAMLECH